MSGAYLGLGKFDEALSLINKIINQVRNSRVTDYYLETLYVKCKALYLTGDIQEALNFISLKRQIIQTLDLLNITDNQKKLHLEFLLLEGEIYLSKNNYEQVFSLCKECLSLSSQIDCQSSIGTVYSILGISYLRLGDLDKALDYFEETKSLFQQLKNGYRLAIAEHHIGFIYANKGQYHLALKQYEKTLHQVEKSNNKFKKQYNIYIWQLLIMR